MDSIWEFSFRSLSSSLDFWLGSRAHRVKVAFLNLKHWMT